MRNDRAAELELIVEEILTNLGPLKISKAKTVELVRSYIKNIEQTYLHNAGIAPGAALPKHKKFLKSLTDMIENYERLPRETKADLMHFAPPFRTWPPQNPAYMVDALLPYLKNLAAVAGSPEFTSSDGAFVKYVQTRDKATKTAAAGWAHILMSKASKQRIVGTADTPYPRIAILMFKAVSGTSISMRQYCRVELKRQREHKRILRELGRDE